MTEHPITPPPELVEQRQWTEMNAYAIAREAARWGADQELEACEKWLSARTGFMDAHDLHIARRPKPPSLKEKALKAFSAVELMAENYKQFDQDIETIRHALEALPD